jgi:hypothetical protein
MKKLYDYVAVTIVGSDVNQVQLSLDHMSRLGWRLVSATDRILVYERETDSKDLEWTRIGREDSVGEGTRTDELLADGWFLHSADTHGIAFIRKRPAK